MTNDYIEAQWMELGEAGAANAAWTFASLCRVSGLSEGELRDLVDYGALVPDNPDTIAERWTFGRHCIVIVQTAVRLRRDFDLDPPGLALALTLVNRIRDLEDELRKMRVLAPRDQK